MFPPSSLEYIWLLLPLLKMLKMSFQLKKSISLSWLTRLQRLCYHLPDSYHSWLYDFPPPPCRHSVSGYFFPVSLTGKLPIDIHVVWVSHHLKFPYSEIGLMKRTSFIVLLNTEFPPSTTSGLLSLLLVLCLLLALLTSYIFYWFFSFILSLLWLECKFHGKS